MKAKGNISYSCQRKVTQSVQFEAEATGLAISCLASISQSEEKNEFIKFNSTLNAQAIVLYGFIFYYPLLLKWFQLQAVDFKHPLLLLQFPTYPPRNFKILKLYKLHIYFYI